MGYDAFIEQETPTEIPTPAEIGALLITARRYRRALQAHVDDIKEHRADEVNEEVANQMEEATQNMGCQLYQLDKAVGLIEKVQTAARGYVSVIERLVEIVAAVRSR